MSEMNVGDRVVAIRDAKLDTVNIFGYGTYEGDVETPEHLPIPPFGISIEQMKKVFGEPPVPVPDTPLIRLDDGTEIYGFECHWGKSEGFDEWIGERELVTVSIDDYRKQDEIPDLDDTED